MAGLTNLLLYMGRGGPYVREEVIKAIKEAGLRLVGDLSEDLSQEVPEADLIVVIGLDSDVLKAVQLAARLKLPIFPVSPPGHATFFSSADWEGVREAFKKLSSGDFRVEELTMIKSSVDGITDTYSLNDVVITQVRSANLMEYTLRIDGEFIWRDRADGVIVATPAGSTAYAFSAGGPLVLRGSKVLSIVPINPLNPLRRALIVPEESRVRIEDIDSRYPCELVSDGVVRVKVRDYVEVSKADIPISLVRLHTKLSEPIEKKEVLSSSSQDIPPSAKFVLKMLEIYGSLTFRELVELTGLPERTVRHALSVLTSKGLIRKSVNLRDARQRIYTLSR